MHPRLARAYIDLVQRSRGWDYRPALAELEALQWAPAAEVAGRRVRKLQALLEHCAKNVPFYRDAFSERGLCLEDFKDERDLARLPVVTKARLREDYTRFFAVEGGRAFDVWASSGSTGSPFHYRVDQASIAANTFAALVRARGWWGGTIGEPEAMIWSGVRDVSGSWKGRFHAAKRRATWGFKNVTLIDTYQLDASAVRSAYARLARRRPRWMRAISSGLYRFCAALDAQGLDGRALGIEYAIYTGEAFPDAQRQLVESVLGCRTICEYGCCELGILAFECPEGGLHLSHENHVIELLVDGRPAEPGESAEIVVTNLNGFSAPLVRYAVGDLVVAAEGRCDCGRTLPLIESVAGRAHDAIPNGRGGFVHGLFFTHLFDALCAVHRFRVVQESLDVLRIEILAPDGLADREIERVRRTTANEMRPGTRIDVVRVDDLPLGPNGKLRWIESRVRPEAPSGQSGLG